MKMSEARKRHTIENIQPIVLVKFKTWLAIVSSSGLYNPAISIKIAKLKWWEITEFEFQLKE